MASLGIPFLFPPICLHGEYFGDGDTSPRVVPLAIAADTIAEDDKTLDLTLSEPAGCAALGCGLPTPRPTAFRLDPEVKEEDIGVHLDGRKRPMPLCERKVIA